MALKKNLALMGVTTAFRLLAGLVSFSIVARLLGPENFGVLMFWFSIAMLLALVTNYGLTPYVLREIGVNADSAKILLSEGLTGKLILTAIVVFFASIYVIGWAPEAALPISLLLIASLADSFSEFLNAGLRAAGRFDIETKVATIGAVFNVIIVAVLVFYFHTVVAAALAYAIARFIVLLLTVFSVSRFFYKLSLASFHDGILLLKKGSGYAADFAFQSLFGQIDSLVLNHFVGPVSVGLHQAGMKVFQGGVQAAGVLSNVFLPRSAALFGKGGKEFLIENQLLQVTFLSVGAVLGGLMALLGEPIVLVLFGSEFSSLVPLMPFFGLLFFMRFFASAWGVVLTAAGLQTYRAWIGALQWLLALPLAIYFVPRLENEGWLISLLISTVVVALMYVLRAYSMSSKPVFLILSGVVFSLVFCFYFWF